MGVERTDSTRSAKAMSRRIVSGVAGLNSIATLQRLWRKERMTVQSREKEI